MIQRTNEESLDMYQQILAISKRRLKKMINSVVFSSNWKNTVRYYRFVRLSPSKNDKQITSHPASKKQDPFVWLFITYYYVLFMATLEYNKIRRDEHLNITSKKVEIRALFDSVISLIACPYRNDGCPFISCWDIKGQLRA